MSKKITENTESKESAENKESTEGKKVTTKYDLKMQRKEQERKKAKRDDLVSRITGIAVVTVLACLVASFPIRSYLTVNGTYIEVAGEKVTRVEFDYNYNLMKNGYIAQNGYYLSMFGIDLNGDLSTQMYSGTLSFQDYFEQMAVENIASNKALRDQMNAAGFDSDVSKDYAKYEETIKNAASAAGMTEKDYIRQTYGVYATASRLKGYVTETLKLGAYYEQVAQEKAPSEADIQAYYEEHADSYDSVDYRVLSINAELPTEPTDLADPVEDAEGTDGTDASGTDANGTDASGTDAAYQPSDAEIEFAMKEAREKAEEALKNISQTGELQENVKGSALSTLLQEWLFDSGRKEGDSTVIENTSGHSYYVVEFVNRHLDQTPTADARIIIVNAGADTGAEEILAEWRSGAATEDSFADLADKYGATSEGGLHEGLTAGGMEAALADWIFDSGRKSGDAVVIAGDEEVHTDEDGSTHTHESGETSYVVYYVGANDPEWHVDIESTLLTERMSAYMEEIGEGYDVTDAKGRLNYVKVQEAEAAASQEGGASQDEGSSQEEGNSQGEENSQGEDNSQGESSSESDSAQQ